MRQLNLIVAICLLFSCGCLMSGSPLVAYADGAGQGTQNFNGNLALLFQVLSPITIQDLGVFNASGSGTITGSIQVAIYNTTTSAQVVGPVTFSGSGFTQIGNDLFQAVASTVLNPGTYAVVAKGFSNSDLNGNINTGSTGPTLNGGGAISFTGAAYDSNATLDLPTTCVGCQAAPSPQNHQFDAGTFEFSTASATPEPASISLILAGLGVGLIGLSRKRRA